MELDEFLFNKSISYLGRYPATKKKLATHLEKKIKKNLISLYEVLKKRIVNLFCLL
jgi:hypothetical protein